MPSLGPMGLVLAAAAGGPAPRSSGRENLGTLSLIEALYASVETGEAVRPTPAGLRSRESPARSNEPATLCVLTYSLLN